MENIHILVKDIESDVTVVNAGFDIDRLLDEADLDKSIMDTGETDIIEKSVLGRLALMTLNAEKYKNILEYEEVESVLEISNKIEVEDYAGDCFEVFINKIFNLLEDSEEKAEWVKRLGLEVDNDSSDKFDIDSMITNK